MSATNNGALGATLGAMSLAKVNESIAWVQNFNIASTELDLPALSNGQLLSELSTSEISTLSDKNYIYITKYESITGSYFNDSKTADVVTSDYDDNPCSTRIRQVTKNSFQIRTESWSDSSSCPSISLSSFKFEKLKKL